MPPTFASGGGGGKSMFVPPPPLSDPELSDQSDVPRRVRQGGRGRPVVTVGRGGAEPPLEKFEPPLAGLGCPP